MGTVFWAFVSDVLHGGTVEVGWFLSAQAVGGVVGAFVIGRWATGLPPMLMLGLGSLGLGLIDAVTFNYPAFLSGIWLGLILMMIVGVPSTSFFTAYSVLLQTEVDDSFRGRAFGTFSSMMAVMMIVGAGLAGAISGSTGVVGTLALQCLAFIAAGVYALAAWRSNVEIRSLEREPTG
jgi:MFS family permease